MRRTPIVLTALAAAAVSYKTHRTISRLTTLLTRAEEEIDEVSRANVALSRRYAALRQPYRLPANTASVTITTEAGAYTLRPATGYYGGGAAISLTLPDGYDPELAQAFNRAIKTFVMEPGGNPSAGGIGDDRALISAGKKRLQASGFTLPAPTMDAVRHALSIALDEVQHLYPFQPVA